MRSSSLGRAERMVLFCLSTAICVFQAAAGPDDVDDGSGAEPSCRCAVLYSGHVRSFAQPRVHLSHRKHLIEQLKKDCDVDVFMYISVEDEVPLRYQTGDFEDALFFTPHTPKYPDVDLAVAALDPVSVAFHQEQAGFIPNACEKSCEPNAFWQLYKMKAVYRMMQEHEIASNLLYTWVIRSRLDIGWMLPLPPLSRFPPSRVYAGHNFFPLADQFLLIPRRFARALFGAVRLCYDCEALQTQSETGAPAQTEGLLRMVLRGEDGSEESSVPFAYYEFPVVIVRTNEGGVCDVLHPHKLSCEMLGFSAVPTASTEDQDDLTSVRCVTVMRRWYQQACVEMFPPLDLDAGPNPSAGEGGPDGPGGERRIFNDGGRYDAQRQRTAMASRLHSERSGSDSLATFEEATRRVEGIHRDLSDLLGMMRVNVVPTQERLTYLLAHHYTFHRPNPLRPGERGPLEEIAIVEGYRLSEIDFNRLILSFSCFLSATTTAALAERDHEGTASEPSRGGGVAVSGEEDEEEDKDILVLKTTAAEEEGLQAVVNCSLVESFHDVWLGVLDTKFDPSETICRGPVLPCLERTLAENRDL